MGRSSESFNKKEKEKKRLSQKQQKAEKMEGRKAQAKKGKSLEDMMAYIDENGNLSSTPPDPGKKRIVNAEETQIGVPKGQNEETGLRTGTITFFNEEKGYGFITESDTGASIFVHIKEMSERAYEKDKVVFEVEKGLKGLNAVNVRKS